MFESANRECCFVAFMFNSFEGAFGQIREEQTFFCSIVSMSAEKKQNPK
jgi:hypothetical protein